MICALLGNVYYQWKERTMKPDPDLLEPLMASLLTLDWEITARSIRKFEKELEVLKVKVGDDPHCKELIKVTLPVCNYLRLRKGSARPASMQFLHEATRTLHRFRRERKLGVAGRKEALKRLFAKFQSLLVDVREINAALARATRAKPEKTALERKVKAVSRTKAKEKTPESKPTVRKGKELPPGAEVLKVIKRYKNGVDIPTLKNLTGFTDRQIRGIVYRASKEGKIKRITRGVYTSV
jgi:hypothetical protein